MMKKAQMLVPTHIAPLPCEGIIASHHECARRTLAFDDANEGGMDAARPSLDVVVDVAEAHSLGATPAGLPEVPRQSEPSVRKWGNHVVFWETPRNRPAHTYSTRRAHPLLLSAPSLTRHREA